MGYHHLHPSVPYLQGNVQAGQPQNTVNNNQRTSRSHSLQPTVQVGDNLTLNRSLSTTRSPVVSGQAQPFDAYGTGQNRESGLQYAQSTNTSQYIGAQGQVQSPSYQDPSHAYQPAEQYFPVEGGPQHLVSQQTRTHQSPPQQPSVPHNPSHSVQGQYTHYQGGDVDYSAGSLHQRRSSSSQYTQQQPSTQLYPQQPQPQPSQPQYQQQQQQHQSSTQPYSQHQQSSPSQERRQYQPSSQQHPQQQQQPSNQYAQHQQPSSQQFTQHQQQLSTPQFTQQQRQHSSQRYTQHQQQPSPQQYTQHQQHGFATTPANASSSFGVSASGESYDIPGEEIRPSRTTRRITTQAGPLCRLTNCRNTAVREVATQELTEYCSLDHMQEDIRRGAPLCPACNKCPRRINGRYCGSPCETWDMERQRQPRQQQQHYPRPPSGARPHLSTPTSSPGNVTWGAPGESSHPGNYASDSQNLLSGGLVHCPRCNTAYSARGGSRPRYDVSLPPCPTCGFCQRT